MGGVKSCFRPSSKGEITFPQNGVKEKRDEDGREVTDGEGEGGGGEGGGTNFNEDENTERGNWSGRLDFILTCLGYAVGLGNIWRFPYLCYRNGGALFLIPYAIMMLFVGVPIFFLELALGQFTSSSPITCWEMACIFRGIGVGMLIVSAMVAIYYNIIIAWAVHFLFSSFTKDVPWQYCHNWWNTEWCAKNLVDNINKTYCDEGLGLNATDDGVCYNGTRPYAIWNETIAEINNLRKILPAQEYFNTRLLRKTFSKGLDDLGPVNWELALCLLFVWSLCALILCKGIKSSGKVVYFTCIFPYVVLLILLVRGVTLPGAYQGIKFFFLEVDISKLGNAAVWKDAATQVFFSLSASWGGLIALSSYNRFQNNFLKDTLIAAFGDMATSIFAGFVIFSFIGFIAHDLNTTIDKVVQQGTGLAFIVYPDAVTRMPLPTLWSILFFLMVATIGLDSELPLIETVCTCVMDLFPSFRKRKWLLSLICCIVGYLLALPLVTNGGIFVFELMDNYCGSWNVLIIALCECICIAYVYGFCRYREDIRLMIGNKPLCCIPWNVISIWWAACWYVISPGLLLFILVFSWIQYEPLTVGDYVYPPWGEGIGWFLTVIVVAGLVFGAISQIGWCIYKKYPLITLFRPNKNWGPALPKHRKLMAAYLTEVPSGQFRVGHREFEVNPKGGSLPPGSKLELRKIKLTAGEVNNGFDSLDSPPHYVYANGDGVYHEKY